MHYTPQDIINENLERRKALAARANAYDPITGEGCTGDRVRIDLAAGAHYVPKEMPIDTQYPLKHRPNYDFEYWLSTINIRPTTLQRNIITQLEAARKTNYGRFIIFHSAGDEIANLLKQWKEEWQESKWSWYLKEECCEAQIQEQELQEIQSLLKQCAARSEAPAPTDSTPNAPPGA